MWPESEKRLLEKGVNQDQKVEMGSMHRPLITTITFDKLTAKSITISI